MNSYRTINLLVLMLYALISIPIVAESLEPINQIYQIHIPLVIRKSGIYQIEENLVYRGSDNAITIKANNVVLDFQTYSLHLSNHEATGVLIKDSSDFVIKGNVISNTSSKKQQGSGIRISKAKHGFIKGVLTRHNRNGLKITKSKFIQIQNSDFSHAAQSGAFVQDSTDIAFDHCVFPDNNNGLTLIGDNKDCVLTNSVFPSSTLSNLNVLQVSGMMVNNCSFTNTHGSSSKPNLVQFGGAKPDQLCSDVIIKNCTIINRPESGGNTAPEGLGLYQGSGFLVESCVIDIDNTDQDPAADLSGIHISNPGLGANGTIASNVIINNCIIQGPATDGIYPDIGSSNVLIENCLVTGAQKDGIFLAGTSASTVINNTVVNNGTNGIFLGEVSFSNAIINNVVNNNGANPILSSIPPFGNGIAIASDSSMNIIQGNTVFSNANNGIDDQGTNNQIFGNTAFGNTNNNFNAATDTIVVSNPGNSSLAASNVTP